MRQLPDHPIIVIEDRVGTVVLDHVLLYESVIDNCGADRLTVLLNLLLFLQLVLDVRAHRPVCYCHSQRRLFKFIL